MKLKILILFVLLNYVASEREPKLADFDKVRIDKDPKALDTVRNLHVNWFAHSIKALMMQLGKDLYSKLPSDQKHSLASCLDKIEDKKDLVSSAKCLVAARKRFQLYQLKLSSHQSSLKDLVIVKKPSFIQMGSKRMRVFDLHGHSAKRMTFKSINFMKPKTTIKKFRTLPYPIKNSFHNSTRFLKFSKKTNPSDYSVYSKRVKRNTFSDLVKSQIENSAKFRNSNNWRVSWLC